MPFECLSKIFESVFSPMKKNYFERVREYHLPNGSRNLIPMNIRFNLQEGMIARDFCDNMGLLTSKIISVLYEKLHYCKIILPYFQKEMKLLHKTNERTYLEKTR